MVSNEHPIDSSAGLRILTGAASALARSVDLDASLRRLLDLAREVLGVPDGALFVQDPDLADFQPAAVVGFDEQGIARLDAALRQPGDLLLAAIRDRLPVRLQSGIGDEATDLLGQLGLRALALQPLVVVRGGIETSVGLMALGWDAGGDPPGNVDALVGPIAELAGVAIDRAQLASLAAERSEWFERMAHTDPLTGLANQRTFGRVLELEIARAGRQGGEVSVVVFDVDGFSALNETAGHDVGDDILRSIAAVLAESVRLVDTVARYGGDEFVVLAPGTAGLSVARRVIDGVAALGPIGGQPVSVSAGVARHPGDGATADELMAATQAALAVARSRGRGGLAEATVRAG